MQYKLYGNNDIDEDIFYHIATNRGVKDDEVDKYRRLDEKECVHPYYLLSNIHTAATTIIDYAKRGDKIIVIPDSDVDGLCSSAMIYMYLKRNLKANIEYRMHQRTKTHGLSSFDFTDLSCDLLIIPDAGTNDTEECKILIESKTVKDIVIIDHHEKEKDNDNFFATIVNNQMSNKYPNKNFCGAGVVYKVLQCMDSLLGFGNYADEFLDLVAFANISDVMDIKSLETKYYINKGLKNIKNKFLLALIEAQSYYLNGELTIHNVQFSLTPICNGCVRVGSLEDIELLFRAFIEEDEWFDYKKRGSDTIIQESIYTRAARLAKNAKGRQDKTRDKCFTQLLTNLKDYPEENKVVMVDGTGIITNGLTGVLAIKIAEKFNKPCLLLTKRFSNTLSAKKRFEAMSGEILQKESKETDLYGGSARNLENSPVESLKDIINETSILSGQGHANACGILDFKISDFDKALEKFNELLKDVVYDPTYKVDYILDSEELDVPFIWELSQLSPYYGQGFKECLIAIENIRLTRSDFNVVGKKMDTINFEFNDIKFVMFRCNENNKLFKWINDTWGDENEIEFTIVGEPTINIFNGIKSPEFIIKDINVIMAQEDDFDDDDEW